MTKKMKTGMKMKRMKLMMLASGGA